MTEHDMQERIEAGDIPLEREPMEVHVHLREERMTIRFTETEIRAIDLESKKRGIGRSTLIRMFVRAGLEESALSDKNSGVRRTTISDKVVVSVKLKGDKSKITRRNSG